MITCITKLMTFTCKICGTVKEGTINQRVCGGTCYREWAKIRSGKRLIRLKLAKSAMERRLRNDEKRVI